MSTLTKAMTEDELLQAVTDALTLHKWRWHHVRRSDKALQQGHPGFPDVVAVRGRQLIFLELKTEKGRVTPDQQAWLDTLGGRVIRPDGLDNFLEAIR